LRDEGWHRRPTKGNWRGRLFLNQVDKRGRVLIIVYWVRVRVRVRVRVWVRIRFRVRVRVRVTVYLQTTQH
jgi:hypothetical protein